MKKAFQEKEVKPVKSESEFNKRIKDATKARKSTALYKKVEEYSEERYKHKEVKPASLAGTVVKSFFTTINKNSRALKHEQSYTCINFQDHSSRVVFHELGEDALSLGLIEQKMVVRNGEPFAVTFATKNLF